MGPSVCNTSAALKGPWGLFSFSESKSKIVVCTSEQHPASFTRALCPFDLYAGLYHCVPSAVCTDSEGISSQLFYAQQGQSCPVLEYCIHP